jgi:hypothetical protein
MSDPRIDRYISSLPEWQQEICAAVRRLVHTADPEVEETIKRTDRPYFVLEGNVCALLAARTPETWPRSNLPEPSPVTQHTTCAPSTAQRLNAVLAQS